MNSSIIDEEQEQTWFGYVERKVGGGEFGIDRSFVLTVGWSVVSTDWIC